MTIEVTFLYSILDQEFIFLRIYINYLFIFEKMVNFFTFLEGLLFDLIFQAVSNFPSITFQTEEKQLC